MVTLLGKDTIGNTTYTEVTVGETGTGSTNESPDYLIGSKYTFTRMTISKLGVYSAVSGNAKLGLFDDSGGSPNNIVITEAAIAATLNQWNYRTLAEVSRYYANGDFWLFCDVDTTGTMRVVASGACKYKALPYANAWTTGGFTGSSQTEMLQAKCYRGKGHILGTRFQAVASGNTVKIRAFFDVGATGNASACLVTDNAGVPGTLIQECASQAITPNAWNDFTITSAAIVDDDYYWPMIQFDDEATLPHRETGGAGDKSYYYGMNYGVFPADFAGLGTVEENAAANLWSIYVEKEIPSYSITITSSGIGTDTSGTVATLDGDAKTQAQLPYLKSLAEDASVVYAFTSPVAGVNNNYDWSSTSGLGQTAQTGTFVVSEAGTIIGTYLSFPIYRELFMTIYPITPMKVAVTPVVLKAKVKQERLKVKVTV